MAANMRRSLSGWTVGPHVRIVATIDKALTSSRNRWMEFPCELNDGQIQVLVQLCLTHLRFFQLDLIRRGSATVWQLLLPTVPHGIIF